MPLDGQPDASGPPSGKFILVGASGYLAGGSPAGTRLPPAWLEGLAGGLRQQLDQPQGAERPVAGDWGDPPLHDVGASRIHLDGCRDSVPNDLHDSWQLGRRRIHLMDAGAVMILGSGAEGAFILKNAGIQFLANLHDAWQLGRRRIHLYGRRDPVQLQRGGRRRPGLQLSS